MTFLALSIDKCSLIQQRDLLQYQEMVLNQDLNRITQEMSDITSEHTGDEDYDPDSDLEMKQLQYQQQIYDSEKESLETQLKELNSEIDSYGKAVETNIKSDCAFKISAG